MGWQRGKTRNRIYMELPKKYRPIAKRCGMTQKEFIETAFNHFITTAVPYYEKLHKDYKHLHKPIRIKPIKLSTESTRGKEERLAYQREYYRRNKERILKDRTKRGI